jgi:formyltetrahydrofolate deformylase
MRSFRLVLVCQDQQAIIARVSRWIADQGGNIVSSDQHSTDPFGGAFFLRIVFVVEKDLSQAQFQERFRGFMAAMGWEGAYWRLVAEDEPKRMAILASKQAHCLLDLLWRVRSQELPAVVPCVISNHADHEQIVESLGFSYHYVSATPQNKPEAEAQIQEILEKNQVDLVVLARYMQILSPEFSERYAGHMINIHHSFLPAFKGANPYSRAKERGVKLVGATAHYVTADLDEGPIIEQDTIRVTHRDSIEDLRRKGADIERLVLGRAVRWHLEDRVLLDGSRTVVFT